MRTHDGEETVFYDSPHDVLSLLPLNTGIVIVLCDKGWYVYSAKIFRLNFTAEREELGCNLKGAKILHPNSKTEKLENTPSTRQNESLGGDHGR
jgi:hypothetical protein